MEAIDTNVVVRLLVTDDPDQCIRAEQLLRRAVAAGGVWVATIVLVETIWVLRRFYKFDRATAAGAVRRLLGVEGVTVEDERAAMRGLVAFETGQADFADYLILEAANRANALPLWTFDEELSRAGGAALVPGA